jgi:hypothetical protein
MFFEFEGNPSAGSSSAGTDGAEKEPLPRLELQLIQMLGLKYSKTQKLSYDMVLFIVLVNCNTVLFDDKHAT